MELLQPVIETARDVGGRLLELYSPDARLPGRNAMLEAAARLDATVRDPLREALGRLRPAARWVTDDEERASLDAGEWWAVDDVEGAVNLLHGRPEWCVSIALVRDGATALAVVYQPVGDRLWTAAPGGGAFGDGRPLAVSPKAAFADAIVETSQVGDEPAELRARIGRALGALMSRALLVRTTIPTTFPLLSVASGRSDAFWQYAPAVTGVAAATLLATEAGAVATDLSGAPWRPGAADLLVAPPALHAGALAALADL
ncbi:inositol monophosphatase family protein [Dactylosporangium sp. NPDC000244]|uniref:inositol monophosphatase family protein n=1 Tax=Dactylosporangium sp. NPDC000244 TaxID=3154365 RepID=UPI00331EE8EE